MKHDQDRHTLTPGPKARLAATRPTAQERQAIHLQVERAAEATGRHRWVSIERQIHIWRWDDAPEAFRLLSTHGGDEDWVAFVPVALDGVWLPFLEAGTGFGICDVYEYPVPGGVVLIGAHA